ncbi:MAG: transcriptional regulator, partial [Candidatus Bathyarchaeia archaeon]
MKPPCMIIVANILPVIRALVAKRLMEKYNFKLVDVAKKMNVTPSAITQYMKGCRGGKILKEIDESKVLEETVTAI